MGGWMGVMDLQVLGLFVFPLGFGFLIPLHFFYDTPDDWIG